MWNQVLTLLLSVKVWLCPNHKPGDLQHMIPAHIQTILLIFLCDIAYVGCFGIVENKSSEVWEIRLMVGPSCSVKLQNFISIAFFSFFFFDFKIPASRTTSWGSIHCYVTLKSQINSKMFFYILTTLLMNKCSHKYGFVSVTQLKQYDIFVLRLNYPPLAM